MKKLQFLKAGDYMKTITRAKYLDRIIELNGTPDIKIITGIRRSGKSKLMQAYIAYLKSNFENINIIFIDFMDLAYEEIKEYHALHAYVEEHYRPQTPDRTHSPRHHPHNQHPDQALPPPVPSSFPELS